MTWLCLVIVLSFPLFGWYHGQLLLLLFVCCRRRCVVREQSDFPRFVVTFPPSNVRVKRSEVRVVRWGDQ